MNLYRHNKTCMKEEKTLGFIILRHVHDERTNKYWIRSYNCIRKNYPENLILIVDDGSNYKYVTNERLYKTTVINSEYQRRGEVLPYYYYLKNKMFDVACIIHDSVFINKYIDMTGVDTYKKLWDFKHTWDLLDLEPTILQLYKDKELLDFYNNKNLWSGCFGGMTVITHDFLKLLDSKYNINILLAVTETKTDRMAFERVFACLLEKVQKNEETFFGDIHAYIKDYLEVENKGKNNFFEMYSHMFQGTIENVDRLNDAPIVKIFSNR